jgi:hypothetical protein
VLTVHCPQYQREIQRWKVYSCPSPDLQRGLHVVHQVDETTPTAEPILIDTRGVLHRTHLLLPPVIPVVIQSHAVTQLVCPTGGGGHRSVPLVGCKEGVVVHDHDHLIKTHGCFVIVNVRKNEALDPSQSVRVHVNTDCGVPFLADEEIPNREGDPVIGHVNCVNSPTYVV